MKLDAVVLRLRRYLVKSMFLYALVVNVLWLIVSSVIADSYKQEQKVPVVYSSKDIEYVNIAEYNSAINPKMLIRFTDDKGNRESQVCRDLIDYGYPKFDDIKDIEPVWDMIHIGEVNEDELHAIVDHFNEGRSCYRCPILSVQDDRFVVEPAQYSERIDYTKVKAALSYDAVTIRELLYVHDNSFITPSKVFFFEWSDIAETPDVNTLKQDIEHCENLADILNNMVIIYSNGETISAMDMYKLDFFEIDNGELKRSKNEFDDTELRAMLGMKLSYYNTKNGNWQFTTIKGEDILVPDRTLGTYVDMDAEVEYVKEFFNVLNYNGLEGRAEYDRIPCLEQDKVSYDLTKDYAEVSIEDQTAYLFLDGQLVWQTPVTTGLAGVHDTPTGVFYVCSKKRDARLKGPDWDCRVDYWIGFLGGIDGFHDAPWKSRYGGAYYLTEGSHGCINTPYKAVQQFYDLVYIGLPVVIY